MITAFLKIYQWSLQRCMNLLLEKITHMARKGLLNGSDNIIILFLWAKNSNMPRLNK